MVQTTTMLPSGDFGSPMLSKPGKQTTVEYYEFRTKDGDLADGARAPPAHKLPRITEEDHDGDKADAYDFRAVELEFLKRPEETKQNTVKKPTESRTNSAKSKAAVKHEQQDPQAALLDKQRQLKELMIANSSHGMHYLQRQFKALDVSYIFSMVIVCSYRLETELLTGSVEKGWPGLMLKR